MASWLRLAPAAATNRRAANNSAAFARNWLAVAASPARPASTEKRGTLTPARPARASTTACSAFDIRTECLCGRPPCWRRCRTGDLPAR